MNAIHKKFVYLHEQGEQIKSSLSIKTLLQEVYSYFSFHLPAIQLFISAWEKSYEDIYHSPPHASVIIANILIMIIRFACYHFLLACNSTFITDSMYLGTIQICRSLNEHYYSSSTTSAIWQIDANCSPFQSLNMLPFHIRLEPLKLKY